MKDSQHTERSRPSRQEIEALCILHAIGDDGCEAHALAGRLGFPNTLANTISLGASSLVEQGLVCVEAARFSRSDKGARWLRERLAELSPEGTYAAP